MRIGPGHPVEGIPYGRAMSFRPAGCQSQRTNDGRARSARRDSPGCAAWPWSRRRPRRCPGGHDVSDDLLVPRLRRRHRRGVGVMTTVEANGVTLGVEDFGDAAAPLVLCAGGTTMLSWPDMLCESLARGGRHVVRYDLRDSGASITVDPEAPAYTLRDLAADAAALARELDDRPAHLAGIGVGGMVAQVAALDHPEAFSALTLAGTRPIAPGPVDDDLPDHDAATMARLFSRSMPDWSDRDAVTEYAAEGAVILGNDPAATRAAAARHMGPHTGHGARSADGQPAGHGVRQARLQAALARSARRARDADAGRARSPRPVLPCRQRQSARARDPRCTTARARTGLDGEPRWGRRGGRDGDAGPIARGPQSSRAPGRRESKPHGKRLW